MIVGLTGGIGSGKSTVAKFFKKLGVPVYDSDIEAKRLMVESEELREEIIKLFGKEAYDDRKLNKTHISEIVFGDRKLLNRLNRIVHPSVRKHFSQWAAQQSSPYVIQETALIFENNIQHNYDAVILVTAPESVRIQRVIDRDDILESDVRSRIKNQLPDNDKAALADYVIENLDLEQTKETVDHIHKQLLAKLLS